MGSVDNFPHLISGQNGFFNIANSDTVFFSDIVFTDLTLIPVALSFWGVDVVYLDADMPTSHLCSYATYGDVDISKALATLMASTLSLPCL